MGIIVFVLNLTGVYLTHVTFSIGVYLTLVTFSIRVYLTHVTLPMSHLGQSYFYFIITG